MVKMTTTTMTVTLMTTSKTKVKMTMVTTGKDGSPITSNVFSTKKFDDPMRLGWRHGDGWVVTTMT